MDFKATLNITRDGLTRLANHLELYQIVQRHGNEVTLILSGTKEVIDRVISESGDAMTQKIWKAKVAIEELVGEVQKHHDAKGDISVLVPLDLGNYVTDHIDLYEAFSGEQGLQINSYQYEWIDEEQE